MLRGTRASLRGSLLALLIAVACDAGPARDAGSTPGSDGSTTRATRPSHQPPPDPCADYPPPFEASFLPEGFDRGMRRGAGPFKGTNYPTDGLVGHYRHGKSAGIHVNFQVRGGPLPYEPAAPRPLTVLGAPGRIGTIEGGFSVEFSLDDCDYRMDTYGLSRADTVNVATSLERAR